MSPEKLLPPIDINDPNYPAVRVGAMASLDCNGVMQDGWKQAPISQWELPSRVATGLIVGETFTRRRPDLEETFGGKTVEIRSMKQVRIVVVLDEGGTLGNLEFEAHNTDFHPDIDQLKIIGVTPAEAVKMLQDPMFEVDDEAVLNLQNTRKAGASKIIRNIGFTPEDEPVRPAA